MDEERKRAIEQNLTNSLRTGDEKARLYAIRELEEIYEAQEKISESAIPVLILTLLDYNKDLRLYAEKILQQFLPDWQDTQSAKSAIPSIIDKLSSSIKDTASGAFRLVRKFDAHALPELVLALEKTADRAQQLKLVQLITQVEAPITAAVPGLIDLLESDNVMVKEAVVKALIKSDSKDQAIFDGLIQNLEDASAEIRLVALKGLLGFDNFTSEDCHAIVKCLLDSNHEVRLAASEVLTQIGELAVPKLIELVQQRTTLRKQEIVRLQETKGNLFKGVDIEKFLLEPGKAAHNVSWHFKDMLQDLNRIEHGILLGIEVLAKTGQGTIESVDALAGALSDVNPAIKEKTILALGAVGAAAESQLTSLYAMYEDPEFNNYEGLVHSLNNIDPDWSTQDAAQPFLQFLMRQLENNKQKLEVLLALKAMNPATFKQLSANQNMPTTFRKEVVELMLMLGDNAKDSLPFLNELIQQEQQNIESSSSERKRIGFGRG